MTALGSGTWLPCAARPEVRLHAGGTAWRLRSLVAMGHDCARIARALQVSPAIVRRLVSGRTSTVTPQFRDMACDLWTAWWDKTPPRATADQRRAAAAALRMADRHNWPAAAGLDEDLLDEPGYRLWSRYRPASGTGEAADFAPVGISTHKHSPSHARRRAS